MSGGKQQLHDIVTPHEHDVLSGRGNFVNYHAGNEHFRALVRKHKVAYVACPKPQKGKFSRMIVDEIKARNPPGRFLKQDANTKLWHDIGEKKALDKTRQALREGAPEISKELTGDEEAAVGGMQNSVLKSNSGGGYGMNDGLGGYGAPDLKNEFDGPLMSQHAALSNNMMQQQQRMQPPNPQLSRQVMNSGGQQHPGSLYAGQIQRMQQQQQQQQQRQMQQRMQQQTLSRQLGGGQLGGMGGLGGMGSPAMTGGMGVGGMGLNPYANFNNDYEELEPTPLDPGLGNSRLPYGQMGGSMQAQLQAQAQLQSQQLQQLQQRQQQQQQAQLHGQGQNMPAPPVISSNNFGQNQRSSLKDSNKRRPEYARENSEQSLNLGSAFEDTIEHGVLDSGTGTDRAKQKFGGSQMSIMSLTVSELDGNDDVGVSGDLSAMFDSSLQISDKRTSTGSSLNANSSALDTRRRSEGESKAGLLDMSVATIGNDMSTVGGMSSALGAEIEDSHADMSFSHMFDDSEKNNV